VPPSSLWRMPNVVRATMWAPFSGSTTSWLASGSGHSPSTSAPRRRALSRGRVLSKCGRSGALSDEDRVSLSLYPSVALPGGNRAANVVPTLEWHPGWRRSGGRSGCARPQLAVSAKSCRATGSTSKRQESAAASPPIIGAATRFMISAPAHRPIGVARGPPPWS